MESRLKPLFGLKMKFLKNKARIKGSIKDPFICLGAISLILFASISLASGPLSDSLYNKGDFSLASLAKAVGGPTQESCFAGLTIKSSCPDSPEYLVMNGDSLIASVPPASFSPQILGALVDGYDYNESQQMITEYTVGEGDTLSSIASKFGVSLNTLLWANSLDSRSLIKTGQKLVILPVSGILHYVKAGDTISEVAKKYKGKADEIVSFNNLSSDGSIYVGDILIIPNGTKPVSSYASAPASAILAGSYFICPVSGGCKLTQGLHFYNAVDFSNGKCGEVIYAAQAGTILKINMTNSTSRYALNGYGNHMTILHSNGVVTYYGHVSAVLVSVGDSVSQGQAIALMGGKPGTAGAGNSTGCHLHFGVSGANNPFSR
jgi:LysM repeat protein